jgi:DNA-directed RNA polymerase subunit K/omega
MNNYQPPDMIKVEDNYSFEKQPFDSLNVNPYEIVVAVAKKARELNDKAQKFLGPEYDVHPINLALKKLEGNKIQFVYSEEKGHTEPPAHE